MVALDNALVSRRIQSSQKRLRRADDNASVVLLLFCVVCALMLGPQVMDLLPVDNPWSNVLGLAYSTCAIGFLCTAYIRWKGGTRPEWGLGQFQLRQLMAGFGVGIILMPVASFIALGVRHALGFGSENPQSEFLNVTGLPLMGKITMTCLVVFLAPLAEELLFRSILFRAFENPRRPMTPVWGTTTLFSLMHGSFSIIVATFLLGWVMGLMRLRSGSIWGAYGLHIGNNGLAWCALLLGFEL